jgi:hypothetical protein
MKRDVAAELLDLRRLHEQRALEALAKCESALNAAKQAVRDAQEETRDYVAAARTKEGELIAQLTGKPADNTEITRLQSIRDSMSFTVRKLRAAETHAHSRTEEAQQDVADAQEAVRQRQRAVLKLENFVEKQRLRIERWRTELAEEEQTTQTKARRKPGAS